MGEPQEVSTEQARLMDDGRRDRNWKRWGPYLSERQWGTVREDYSDNGDSWRSFPHDHARSRAYRWGEDGLLGICDREGRLCFALALWNGRDPILKERLFGLTGPEGNHGEDVKEAYFYLDSTPTHSYMKALYKYPLSEFPYRRLVEENYRRGYTDRELDLEDTGVFDANEYVDVFAEYAKAQPNDILIQITLENRADHLASLHVLPTLWFRNTWAWGRSGEGYWKKPRLVREGGCVVAEHESLGRFRFDVEPAGGSVTPAFLFTENETNGKRLWGTENDAPYVKDAFHEYVVDGRKDAVNPAEEGTKVAAHFVVALPARGRVTLRLRLAAEEHATGNPFGPEFDQVMERRLREADEFYASKISRGATPDERVAARQCYAGMLWSKQFYNYIVKQWLDGDPDQPLPPPARWHGRNSQWQHIYNRDVISIPDKWEYPWYAAWDLAFHMVPFAHVDPDFAKAQLVLFLREWYMHPNGQLPAYEFALGDVNPPVHAWACLRVYKLTGEPGKRDRAFLARTFQKLLINFTWWVNRKDEEGNNLFSGGFLGLDNIGIFDRNRPLPTGGHLEQADGTAWMAFYCATMLAIALELASEEPVYEDLASKFFEHFVAITDAMNAIGGGLWDEQDGFYYDHIHAAGQDVPLRVRSMVGIVPLFAVQILEEQTMERLPGFRRRLQWFLENRPELARYVSYYERSGHHRHRLLAIANEERLTRVLRYVLDETEFLAPGGVRSLSRFHREHPFVMQCDGQEYRVDYMPAEGNTGFFGGNSNWRGPVWFPLNHLLVESLERYYHFFGDGLTVECPTGSGRRMNLKEVAHEIASRLARMFLPDANGRRPCHGDNMRFATDPHWKDLVLFHEYFSGDTSRGLGASHQTGWTGLAARFIQDLGHARGEARS